MRIPRVHLREFLILARLLTDYRQFPTSFVLVSSCLTLLPFFLRFLHHRLLRRLLLKMSMKEQQIDRRSLVGTEHVVEDVGGVLDGRFQYSSLVDGVSRRGRVLLRPGCVLNHVGIVGVLVPGLFGRMSVSVSLDGYFGLEVVGGEKGEKGVSMVVFFIF